MQAVKLFVVVIIIAVFTAISVQAEEAPLAEKMSFDLRFYSLRPGSTISPGIWEKKNGFETMDHDSRKDPGFRVALIFRDDNFDRMWGRPANIQIRLAYQHFNAENEFWMFRHASDQGPIDQSFPVTRIKHDSIILHALGTIDLVAGKNWNWRISTFPTPFLALEKNNKRYNVATGIMPFTELSLWNITLEAGYGVRVPLVYKEDKNIIWDRGAYFGVGYKIRNLKPDFWN